MHTLPKPCFLYLFLSCSLMLVTTLAYAQNSEPHVTASLLLGQGDQLPRVKAEIAAGNPVFVAALEEIVEEADAAFEKPIVNVVDEGALPPSGDPHDYYSYSPYWWPDPENPDGPYIWRDGEVNPDRYTSDVSRLESMVDRVTSLVPAWYFTGEDRYAKSAVEQLRAWFLDPATKMNPNVQFGQKRRGHNYNSPSGVLEAWRMHWVIDCAILLESFPGWTEEDANALRSWFSQFATWMVESPEGIEESMHRTIMVPGIMHNSFFMHSMAKTSIWRANNLTTCLHAYFPRYSSMAANRRSSSAPDRSTTAFSMPGR